MGIRDAVEVGVDNPKDRKTKIDDKIDGYKRGGVVKVKW